ncbi:MAG: hypothetical protein D6795_07900 [Deltaproteobacteria bacterium]|nr:MAG: hypothetical protein D6795_07900 [Deltaproteobacteria bacterium]
MAKFIRKYPLLAALAFLLLWIGVVRYCKPPPLEPEKLLLERPWFDRRPSGPNEKFHLWVWTAKRAGVYQHRTLFTGEFETFFFLHDKERIRFLFPASKKRMETAYTIEEACDAPKPFDLCLTMESPPYGPKRYFSIRHHEEMERFVETLRTDALPSGIEPKLEGEGIALPDSFPFGLLPLP